MKKLKYLGGVLAFCSLINTVTGQWLIFPQYLENHYEPIVPFDAVSVDYSNESGAFIEEVREQYIFKANGGFVIDSAYRVDNRTNDTSYSSIKSETALQRVYEIYREVNGAKQILNDYSIFYDTLGRIVNYIDRRKQMDGTTDNYRFFFYYNAANKLDSAAVFFSQFRY